MKAERIDFLHQVCTEPTDWAPRDLLVRERECTRHECVNGQLYGCVHVWEDPITYRVDDLPGGPGYMLYQGSRCVAGCGLVILRNQTHVLPEAPAVKPWYEEEVQV